MFRFSIYFSIVGVDFEIDFDFGEIWHEESNASGEREKRFKELAINCDRFRLRVASTAPVANQPQISICFGTGFSRGLAAGRYFYDFNSAPHMFVRLKSS